MARPTPNVSPTTRFPLVAPAPVGPLTPGGTPSFTVIIPAYNVAATVGDAIASALDQTLPADQVIVVDDGSTDATATVVEPWLDRITFIRTQNRGVSAARNEACRHANGDFIANLDGDDVFLPERLEALAALSTSRPDLDILVTNVLYEQPDGRAELFFGSRYRFPTADQRSAILSGNFAQHAAVRRSAFESIGGYDEGIRISEDWDLWLRLILAGSRAGLVDVPLIRYRRRVDGATSDVAALIRADDPLRRALLRDDLSDEERRIAAAVVVQRQRLLQVHEAAQAVRSLETGWRSRARRIALTSGHPASTRLKAGAAAVLPAFAVRRLNRPPSAADGDPAK